MRILILLIFIMMLLPGSFSHIARAEGQPAEAVTLQFGFYDLMLQKREVYNSKMITAGNTIKSDIRSPDDNQFILQGSFNLARKEGKKRYFTYTPVHFVPSQSSHMLSGNVDFLTNSEFWMQQYKPDGVPLISMQNGMLFIYPLDNK